MWCEMQKDESQKQFEALREFFVRVHANIVRPLIWRMTGICILMLGILSIVEIIDILEVGWQRSLVMAVVVAVSSYWYIWFSWRAWR